MCMLHILILIQIVPPQILLRLVKEDEDDSLMLCFSMMSLEMKSVQNLRDGTQGEVPLDLLTYLKGEEEDFHPLDGLIGICFSAHPQVRGWSVAFAEPVLVPYTKYKYNCNHSYITLHWCLPYLWI